MIQQTETYRLRRVVSIYAIVTADPPGLRCSDLTTYPFKRIPRPMYPLDPDCEFVVE